MKKLLCILLLGFALAVGAWAQVTTWTNPKVTDEGLLPRSMLSDLTSGLFYDEIDTIVLSPAELSNYTGIGLFTSYANFDSYWNETSGPAPISPFVAAPFGYGRYLFGVTLPILSFRMGAFAGAELNAGNLLDEDNNVATPAVAAYTLTVNDTIDAIPTIGVPEYTTALTVNASGASAASKFSAAAGIDLGFMGASLLANWESNSESVGATTHYTWLLGADPGYTAAAVPANTVTSYWGLLGKADPAAPADAGAVTLFHQANAWFIGLTGELPIVFPITARVGAGGGENNDLAYSYPWTQVWTITNVPGAAANTDLRTGYTVGGLPLATNGLYFAAIPGTGYTQAFPLAAPGAPASDPDHFMDSDFYGRAGGYVDPLFHLSSVITLKTRAGIDYQLDLKNQNPATMISLDWTNGVSAHYTASQTVTAPETTLTHNVDLDLGGVFEFTEPTNFLTASVGLFYIPTYSFGSTTSGDSVTTTSFFYSEATPVRPDATGTTTVIGPTGDRGTMTVTTTTVTTGASGTTVLTHRFALPVAVKLNIVPDKLQLIGSYRLDHTYATTTNWDNTDGTITTTTTILNAAGTDVTPAAGVVSVDHTTTADSTSSITATTWTGTPQFMVRWMPLPQLTVDFWGQTIINSLNFQLLWFDPSIFITTLGLNVSFRF